jgi:hypothetical protein
VGNYNGNEITFKADGAVYIGNINGDKMLGTCTDDSKGRKSDFVAIKTIQ